MLLPNCRSKGAKHPFKKTTDVPTVAEVEKIDETTLGTDSQSMLLKCYKRIIEEGYNFEATDWQDLDWACNCINEEECTIDLDSEFYTLEDECSNKLNNRIDRSNFGQNSDSSVPEPNVVMVVECMAPTMTNPFTDTEMTKNEMGIIVVIIDMAIIVLFLIFISIVETSQKNFVKKFKDQTIEMTDFSIRVKNLPKDI